MVWGLERFVSEGKSVRVVSHSVPVRLATVRQLAAQVGTSGIKHNDNVMNLIRKDTFLSRFDSILLVFLNC